MSLQGVIDLLYEHVLSVFPLSLFMFVLFVLGTLFVRPDRHPTRPPPKKTQ